MELDLFADPPPAEPLRLEPPPDLQGLPLYLGTSSWSFDDWRGSVYPSDAKSIDYVTYYAQHFPVVEIDSTFYRIPTTSMVDGWYRRTPAGFRFAAKIPKVITHD